MRTYSITGIRLRRRVRTTVPDQASSPVPDLFQRDFTAGEPGRKLMGDITHLPLAGGKFLHLIHPRCRGDREALWVLLATRQSAVPASTAAINLLEALIISAPDELQGMKQGSGCSLRDDSGPADQNIEQRTSYARSPCEARLSASKPCVLKQAGGQSPWVLPRRAGRPEVRLPGDHGARSHR
ncbi:hypothetical protein [Streptomyces sp. NPDC091268]|uniref:hypothetical protein n=1 Tax=Streptomyces sp. NPDC091268 TaxID=3365979 RepID=UPI0037FC1683